MRLAALWDWGRLRRWTPRPGARPTSRSSRLCSMRSVGWDRWAPARTPFGRTSISPRSRWLVSVRRSCFIGLPADPAIQADRAAVVGHRIREAGVDQAVAYRRPVDGNGIRARRDAGTTHRTDPDVKVIGPEITLCNQLPY